MCEDHDVYDETLEKPNCRRCDNSTSLRLLRYGCLTAVCFCVLSFHSTVHHQVGGIEHSSSSLSFINFKATHLGDTYEIEGGPPDPHRYRGSLNLIYPLPPVQTRYVLIRPPSFQLELGPATSPSIRQAAQDLDQVSACLLLQLSCSASACSQKPRRCPPTFPAAPTRLSADVSHTMPPSPTARHSAMPCSKSNRQAR